MAEAKKIETCEDLVDAVYNIKKLTEELKTQQKELPEEKESHLVKSLIESLDKVNEGFRDIFRELLKDD